MGIRKIGCSMSWTWQMLWKTRYQKDIGLQSNSKNRFKRPFNQGWPDSICYKKFSQWKLRSFLYWSRDLSQTFQVATLIFLATIESYLSKLRAVLNSKLNPTLYGHGPFYLLVLFGLDFVSWIFIKTFQIFLEVNADINRVILTSWSTY